MIMKLPNQVVSMTICNVVSEISAMRIRATLRRVIHLEELCWIISFLGRVCTKFRRLKTRIKNK
jgi:uncharacterized membrane protein YGL010W